MDEEQRLTVPIPDPSQLPPELAQLKRFILWRHPDKVPMAPWRTGGWEAVNPLDYSNWTDLRTAIEWAGKRPGTGVGIVLGGGIVGIDLDHAVDEKGNIKPEAQEIIQKANSYTEVSPSGQGIHILIRGAIHHPIRLEGLEVYSDGRYFTLTGKRLLTSPLVLAEAQELIDELTQRYIEKTVSPVRKRGEKNIPILGVYEKFGGNLAKLKKRGRHLQGPHPVHGSDTGFNFSIDPEKNVWFCYRHWHGGGPVSLAAIMGGVIKCEEFGPAGVTGSKLDATLKMLEEKGLILTPEGESEWSRAWELVTERMEEVFLEGESGEPWMAVRTGKSPPQVLNLWIRGEEWEAWLSEAVVEKYGKGLRPEVKTMLRETLLGMAFASHKRRRLWLLAAPDEEGGIWIDPGWEDGRKIQVTVAGWKVADCPQPNPFQRSGLTMPLPVPVPCEDPRALLERFFVPPNIEENREAAKIVLTVYPCTLPLTFVPRAGLALLGEHGSGKSMLTKRLLKLWGVPDTTCVHETDIRDLVVKLRWLPLLGLDNVRRIEPEVADLVSSAVTGTTWIGRELYTDAGVKAVRLARAVIINGIAPNLTSYPDLLDRFILIRLRKLDAGERADERLLWQEFGERHAELLGAALTAIAGGLSNLEQVRAELRGALPRMADWTIWGEAIARGLGFGPLEFLKAYKSLIQEAVLTTLEENPLGRMMLALAESLSQLPEEPVEEPGGYPLERRNRWEGTPGQLLKVLEDLAEKRGESVASLREEGFPSTAAALGKKLREITAPLAERGVKVSTERVFGTRVIRIQVGG